MNGDPPFTPHRLIAVLAGGAVIAALYFGREFFLPLVFAILISFMLAPVIRRLEKWHLGRIGSVILTTVVAFLLIGGIAYTVTGQLIDLANQLPNYKTNIRAKVAAVKQQQAKGSALDHVTETLKEITDESTENKPGEVSPDSKGNPPAVPVQVVHQADNALTLLRGYISPLLGPLGNTAVIVIFVIFILIGREDLRDRIIHLIGRGRLHVTTQALDDAGRRVSRYLFAQFIVNVTYGIPVGLGLYFIGIPNAVLWGLLATILRFVPYVGPWIAAAFPILLSIAVSPGWTAPMLTIGLFVVMELVSNNVVEPWLYGASTGLSPMAVIVSAVFWTWLWGPIGLILATPLTVCLAVIGKHIPSLAFLDVLLSQAPPIAVGDRLYQRLLAGDEEEAVEIVEEYITAHSLAEAYDNVVIPTLRQSEEDCRTGVLAEGSVREIHAMIRRLLTAVDETPPLAPEVPVPVLCLPASSEADEFGAIMLAHLLEKRSTSSRVVSSKSLTSEMVELAAESGASIFCISAFPPASVMPATYLAKKIRARMPEARVIVGYWHDQESEDRRMHRLKRAQADEIFLTLEKASVEIALVAGLKTEPAPTPDPVMLEIQPA